jgi:hypothetical protein
MPSLEASNRPKQKPPRRVRIDPTWTIAGNLARLSGFKRAEDAEHFFDGLRKAALPEK